MIDQEKEINERNWDVLIILDACRFDYFKNLYKSYLEGNLKKAKSPVSAENGIATSEWCKKTFKKYYEDVIYISTTPHVNSKTEVNGFKGSEHFFKIIDLWDHGWDEEMGTVLPERVNKEVEDIIDRYSQNRIIVHYMQPHFPYISLDNPENPKSRAPEDRNSLSRSFRSFLGSKVRKLLGGELTRGILRVLGMGSVNPMHEILNKRGRKKLVEAYEENLRRVLESVSYLIESVSGEIVVTSDHGEYLGEEGFYGHSYLPDHPILTTVPWLEIDNPKE